VALPQHPDRHFAASTGGPQRLLQFFRQVDTFQQPSAFAGNDRRNGKTVFVNQTKLDKLGRNIYPTD
jgi:hypothetical protein